jgi:hypothetical protein
MLVGVSAENGYGFDAPTRRSEPRALVFNLPCSGLEINVHQRFNVRILELIDRASGDRIESKGNRLPFTHSGGCDQGPRRLRGRGQLGLG